MEGVDPRTMETAGPLPYIQGIGDEVLDFMGFCIFFSFLFFFCLWRCLRRADSPVAVEPEVVQFRNTGLQRERQGRADGSSPHVDHRRRSWADAVCPICLCGVEYPCETNCGHLFCTSCLIGYWRHVGHRTHLPCPCCRRNITLLLESFPERNTDAARESLRDISAYNQAATQPRWSIGTIVREVPVLLRRLVNEPFTAYNAVLWLHVGILVLTMFLYIVSPLDILPESIFGLLGMVDDILVLAGAFLLGLTSYRQQLLARQR